MHELHEAEIKYTDVKTYKTKIKKNSTTNINAESHMVYTPEKMAHEY